MKMIISFKPFCKSDLSLWEKWILVPHVKNTWFIEGYESPDYINQKIKGDGYNYPFVICADEKPIGYIQCCDLYAYKKLCENKKGLFTDEPLGTFCVDLFIADSDYLDKGYGTETVKSFVKLILNTFFANQILIDPNVNNKRAIRCYEKAGFKKRKIKNDGVTNSQIMEINIEKNISQEHLYQFLQPLTKWMYEETDISSVGIVGSFARGTEHEESDIDLIFLCKNKIKYLENSEWATQFGKIAKTQIEEYGAVTSLRVWYQDSFEVEFGYAAESWATTPIDSGTRHVIKDGMRILIDKQGLLKNLLAELNPTSARFY